jgi:XTP/dITP diphosphohydrolase
MPLVFATRNQGKLVELRELVTGIDVIDVEEAARRLGHEIPDVVEDADTFAGNAIKKARETSAATGWPALADDSGLEVDALGGRPGVRSARFAHERATDAENNAALLRELEDIDEGARGARFRCVLALADPWREAEEYVAQGSCEGSIARTPRGHGGFGYDPLFLVSGKDGRAMAELSETEKNLISHRALAVEQLRTILVRLLNERLDETERIAG